MFGGIAVKEKIYTRETTQISIGLRIGQPVPLRESPDTCHDILDFVEYFFLVHNYALLLICKATNKN